MTNRALSHVRTILTLVHLRVLSILLIGWVSVDANAQSQCPPGMIPVQGGCISPVGGNSSSFDVEYENRYGAIATSNDPSNDIAGTATAQTSEESAIQLALSKCGRNCEIWFTVVNTCMAVSEGSTDIVHALFGTGQSEARASKNAQKECKKRGYSNCAVKFSSCSLPERVR